MENSKAAGFVIYKVNDQKEIVFLGLEALPYFQKKNNGLYDIPKGKIDPGETAKEAAVREAKEEADIDIKAIEAGPYTYDKMTVWLSESYLEPKVGINPHTNQEEHLSCTWVKPDAMEAQCLDYLVPAISWAREHLGV